MGTTRHITVTAVVAAALLQSACASRPPAAAASLRYGSDCADARARARADSAAAGLMPPRPVDVFLPPMPVPATVRGRTAVLAVGVDSVGRVARDAVWLAGVPDSAYARTIRERATSLTFVPASIDGCAVSGRATITYTF